MATGVGLTWPDYAVFSLVLIISILIGFAPSCLGGWQKTTSEYLTADRSLHLFPVALSLLVTYMSGITLLGIATEVYYFGIQFWFWMFGHIFGAIFTMVLYVPLIYPLGISSTNEYFKLRFKSNAVVLLGASLQIVDLVLFTGFVVYAPALFFNTVSGFPIWASIILLSVVSSLYTALGGIKAVIWTDVFQAFIMLAGVLSVIIQGTIKVGGVSNTWALYQNGGRVFVDFAPSPFKRMDFWSVGLLQSVQWTLHYGILQMGLQRYTSLPTYRKAMTSIVLLIPMNLVIQSLCAVMGVVAFAYYAGLGCDPYGIGSISNLNQIVPYLVMDIFRFPGLPGIFFAAIFAGALSNISSALAGLATFTWEDILKQRFTKIAEHKKMCITRGLVLFYGILCMGTAFVVSNIGGTLIQMVTRVHLIVALPIGVLFTLGAGWPKTNAKSGAMAAMVTLAFMGWISTGNMLYQIHQTPLPTDTDGCAAINITGQSLPHHISLASNSTTASVPHDNGYEDLPDGLRSFYSISYLWQPFFGLLVGIVTGILLSYIPGFSERKPTEERLIYPIMRPLWKRVKGAISCSQSANQNGFYKGVYFSNRKKYQETEDQQKINPEIRMVIGGSKPESSV